MTNPIEDVYPIRWNKETNVYDMYKNNQIIGHVTQEQLDAMPVEEVMTFYKYVKHTQVNYDPIVENLDEVITSK